MTDDAHNEENDLLADAARRRRRQLTLLGISLALTATVIAGAFVLVERTVKPLAEARVQAPAPSAPPQITCGEFEGEECVRRDFLDALREFNFATRPALDAVSLGAWAADRAEAIDSLEGKALDAFDQGEYQEAIMAITEAIIAAEDALSLAEQEFASNLARAEQAFTENDSALASQAIERALLLDPNSTEAEALSRRITVLPAVLEALEGARVAAVENRPTEEVRQLRAARVLDPTREGLSERIATLENADQASRYRGAVAAAEGALARGQLDDAQSAIDRARTIDPGKDLTYLQQRLDDARLERRLSAALVRGDDARARENWGDALRAYEQAIALDPTNARAVGGAQDAQDVVSGLDKLRIYLRDPLRIGSSRAGEAARRLSAELAPRRGLSTVLDGQLDELDRYLDLVQQPVKITVISDGLTDISVRRVGQVGKRKQATIELTPGRYEVEGTRAGYRSKLVALDVNFGIERMRVEVVCDEPTA